MRTPHLHACCYEFHWLEVSLLLLQQVIGRHCHKFSDVSRTNSFNYCFCLVRSNQPLRKFTSLIFRFWSEVNTVVMVNLKHMSNFPSVILRLTRKSTSVTAAAFAQQSHTRSVQLQKPLLAPHINPARKEAQHKWNINTFKVWCDVFLRD